MKYLIEKLEEALYQAKNRLLKKEADDDDKEELYNYLKSTGPRHCVDWVRRNGGTLDDYMDYIKEELKKEKADEDKPIGHCAIDGSDFIPFGQYDEPGLLWEMPDDKMPNYSYSLSEDEAGCDHLSNLYKTDYGAYCKDCDTKFIEKIPEKCYHIVGLPPHRLFLVGEAEVVHSKSLRFKYCPLCGEELDHG